MKKIFMMTLAILCVGIMLFAFAACGDEAKKEEKAEETKTEEVSNAAPIVGKWVYEDSDDMYYVFNEDATGSYFFLGGEITFSYGDTGEEVTLYYDDGSEPNTFKYTIDGKTLNIEDSFGSIVTYIKK
ncbi:MAG: hypothetical protein E7473_12145 [Ruminococcaceae bacterium]|nr:hypothetical protein [Oscillospiraceae bacterium]